MNLSNMSEGWDDFADPIDKKQASRRTDNRLKVESEEPSESKQDDQSETGCSWGQEERSDRPTAAAKYGNKNLQDDDVESANFINLYEQYVSDRELIPKQTKKFKGYSKNAQQYLRDWFEYEGHGELKPELKSTNLNEFMCSIVLPVDGDHFPLTSKLHQTKKNAIDEVCLDACRLLDACGMLTTFSDYKNEDEGEDLERKRRIAEANKEDDIEFDSAATTKRHCVESGIGGNREVHSTNLKAGGRSNVNTYDSLMAQWSAVNMSILQLKAKLVKLDLSVTKANAKPVKKSQGDTYDEEDSEIDPLDQFMSNLETKTALSMDEKIEKSRLKLQIATQEKEQSKLAKMIELAKPASRRTN